jgi:hypothetical protein
MRGSKTRFGWVCALGVWRAGSGWAQTANPRDLTTVSLEDRMSIQVTSVSKKELNRCANRNPPENRPHRSLVLRKLR